MSSDKALVARKVGKSYTLRHTDEPSTTLAEAVAQRFKHPLRRAEKSHFWALIDVDLEVEAGRILGVIGRNGAGKSTLLKILSRITAPTVGRVDVFGRMGSLLEVGTGFHPELTGRENIFLNGTILGMRRREVAARFDEIVSFAGVEQFLDTPVKRYSSGMYVRLAFAVAAHLDTDILLIDEVLAVGDAAFQRKSLGKMSEVAHDGRTVILVSHNMGAISQMADQCLLLHDGRVAACGATEDVLAIYSQLNESTSVDSDFAAASRPEPWLNRVASLVSGELQDAPGGLVRAAAPLRLMLTVEAQDLIDELCFTTIVNSIDGTPVGTAFSQGAGVALAPAEKATYQLNFGALPLAPGHYYLTLAVGTRTLDGIRNFDVVTDVLHFEQAPNASTERSEVWYPGWGSVWLEAPSVKRLS